MTNIFNQIFAVIAAGAIAVSGFLFGGTPPAQTDALSATNPIETPVALFETSLANSISTSATSMTLVSALTKDGTTLASSTYSFIIDEGSASEEFVIADCTATACTNMTRGLSVLTGTTTVATLQKAHRRGASVKITDAPLLLKLTRIVNGIAAFPNKLSYTSAPSFTNGFDIIDKAYADTIAVNAGVAASNSVPGLFFSATGLQAASSTASALYNALPYLYALPASIATDTPNTATKGSRVVMSDILGNVWQTVLANLGLNNTFTGTNTFAATTTYSGAVVTTETTIATSTSMTVNFSSGNRQLIRKGSAGMTVAFSSYVAGESLLLTVCNPTGVSGGALTFSGVLWPGGTAPTLTTTANKCDVVTINATNATSTLVLLGGFNLNY